MKKKALCLTALAVILPLYALAVDVRHYSITSVTYSGNAIGKTKSIDGYRAFYSQERTEDGKNRYQVYDFEVAGPALDEQDLSWRDFPGFAGYEVELGGYADLTEAMDDLAGVPHRSLESFDIYVTLMDMIMYEEFRSTMVNELLETGASTYTQEPYEIRLPDWDPVINNIVINVGETVFQYLAAGEEENLFYYKTDGTFIKQLIFYSGFLMPSRGTSRYMGFVKLDAVNEVTYATLSEYYTGWVLAAYVLPVPAVERREQVLKLID
jgi:hypothetical protein